jgi:glutathione S-transferase
MPPMKLYLTPTSPYGRIANIARLEKGLGDRVELVWTRTRNPDDPLLGVNPSGRIPFLLLDDSSGDGTSFEDTAVIVEFFDRMAPPLQFARPDFDPAAPAAYWEHRRLEAMARSLLDGVSVWAREVLRPAGEQSPSIIAHERCRAARLAGYFESVIGGAPFIGQINMTQLLLFCALDMERRLPDFDWRAGRPGLAAWHGRLLTVPSVRDSVPPLGV